MAPALLQRAIIRPRRRSDDVFFVGGDRLALQSSDTVAISYIEERYEDHGVENSEENSNKDTPVENEQQVRPLYFPCTSPHCNEVFDTIAQAQRHYEEKHCFQCIECNNFYPNEYLLDLHIEETHNAYFQLLLERQQQQHQGSTNSSGALYKCLVMNCQSKFPSDKERYRHLRSVHGYPNWFRFHSKKNGVIENMAKPTSVTGDKLSLIKTKQWWRNKRKKFANLNQNGDNGSNNNNDEDEGENMVIVQDSSDDAKKEKLKTKRRERKEKKKKTNASIPCRFYNSKGGCWRGDNCMFLHSHTSTIKPKNNVKSTQEQHHSSEDLESPQNMDVCQEIDSLANQMKTKAKISIPNNISFGRRRRNY